MPAVSGYRYPSVWFSGDFVLRRVLCYSCVCLTVLQVSLLVLPCRKSVYPSVTGNPTVAFIFSPISGGGNAPAFGTCLPVSSSIPALPNPFESVVTLQWIRMTSQTGAISQGFVRTWAAQRCGHRCIIQQGIGHPFQKDFGDGFFRLDPFLYK